MAVSLSKPIARNITQTGRANVLPQVEKEYKKYGYGDEKISGRGGATGMPIILRSTQDLKKVNTSRKTEFPRIIQKGLKAAVKKLKKNKVETENFQKLKPQQRRIFNLNGPPRCGNKDEVNIRHRQLHSRRKRYALQGSKFSKHLITYKITGYSKKLTKAEVNETIAKAFRVWAEVIPLQFRWSSKNEDIEIFFAEGHHGPNDTFDGKGGLLAHALYPQYGSDVHIDDAEDWTTGTPSFYSQKRLLNVVVHEIGHSLGLLHTSVPGSIMIAYYSRSPTVHLGDDDIKGVQSLYGLCETEIDGIELWMKNRRTYIFRRNQYWRFEDSKHHAERNYPKPLSGWRGLPGDIDEMLLWGGNWGTYFFKGSKYYRYDDVNDHVLYEKNISYGWPGVPDNIDAALTHSDLETYFFKGDNVYLFDNKLNKVAAGYPKKIPEVFPRLPGNLDAAFRWFYDGKSYFFKEKKFYRWNENLGRVEGPYISKHLWKNLCSV